MYCPEHEAISVEPKTVRAILDAVLQGRANTRNQLAAQLNISSMTVGKAVRMLCRTDLLLEKEEPTPRGRHPLCLYPSERLHSLILYLTPTHATVSLCSAMGGEMERFTVKYIDSLPWEGNLAYLRGSFEQCLARWKKIDTGVGIGVILREDCAFGAYAMSVLTQILRPDAVVRDRELLTRELSRGEYGGSALYFSYGETVTPMLIMGEMCVDGLRFKHSSDQLLNDVMGLLSLIPVSTVIAESSDDFKRARNEFLQAVADRLPESRKGCVQWRNDTARRLSEQAMERVLRRQYVDVWLLQ